MPNKSRYYVLAIFFIWSATEVSVWSTFSAIPTCSKKKLHCDSNDLKLLLNWGSLLGIVPWFALIPESLFEIRRQMKFGMLLMALGTTIRLIPFFTDQSIVWVHVGQMLNAVSGFFSCSLMGSVSQRYFSPHERGAATACLFISLYTGFALTFSCSHLIVGESCGGFSPYIVGHACVSWFVFFSSMMYFPAPTLEEEDSEVPELNEPLRWSHFEGAVLVAIIQSLQNGIRNSWSPLIPDLLTEFSESKKDLLSTITMIGGMFGSFSLGPLLYSSFMRENLKGIALVQAITICGFVALFAVSVHTYLWDPLIPNSYLSMCIIIFLMGVSLGLQNALMMETGKHFSADLPPEYAGGINIVLANVTASAFLFVPASVLRDWMNLIFLFSTGAAIFVTTLLKDPKVKKGYAPIQD